MSRGSLIIPDSFDRSELTRIILAEIVCHVILSCHIKDPPNSLKAKQSLLIIDWKLQKHIYRSTHNLQRVFVGVVAVVLKCAAAAAAVVSCCFCDNISPGFQENVIENWHSDYLANDYLNDDHSIEKLTRSSVIREYNWRIICPSIVCRTLCPLLQDIR